MFEARHTQIPALGHTMAQIMTSNEPFYKHLPDLIIRVLKAHYHTFEWSLYDFTYSLEVQTLTRVVSFDYTVSRFENSKGPRFAPRMDEPFCDVASKSSYSLQYQSEDVNYSFQPNVINIRRRGIIARDKL